MKQNRKPKGERVKLILYVPEDFKSWLKAQAEVGAYPSVSAFVNERYFSEDRNKLHK